MAFKAACLLAWNPAHASEVADRALVDLVRLPPSRRTEDSLLGITKRLAMERYDPVAWPENLSDEDLSVRTALSGCLTVTERAWVVLAFYDGWTQQQIAERFGVTRDTVSRTLKRATTKLSAALRQTGQP